MSRIIWNERKIEERQKAGYGEGALAAYKPWLGVTDLSSKGRSRRIWSNKTGRFHHVFSDVEHNIFIALEWSRSVVDIREQYPLDRDLTQTIAQQICVRHPHYPGTGVPAVMTVDFLVTIASADGDSYMALNAKRDEEAEDETSLNKLEIQRRYFEQIEVPHHLIYHSQLPTSKIKNIQWIRDAQLKPDEIEPQAGFYSGLMRRMGDELTAQPKEAVLSLAAYCRSFDERYGFELGTGLRVAKMLMHERALNVDLASPDLANAELRELLMTSLPGRLRAVGGFGAVQ